MKIWKTLAVSAAFATSLLASTASAETGRFWDHFGDPENPMGDLVAPDAAMVKLFAQPRLLEMGALEPLGAKIDGWAGKADLLDNLLELNKGPDGQQYYLPIQYVVLYLYYRADLFEAAGLTPPKTCDEFRDAAIKLTKAPTTYGFGLRGGKGGWDQWGAFVLSQGAKLEPGGLTTPQAIAANQWLIDLFQKDKVIPASAPNDGF